MEKLNYVSRISALLLVFVLVGFMGCGTTPQAGGGSGTEDGGAAQLAADLGKAASGDTITLTGRAQLATALTVPAGVTLDLTADGAALELRDGAVLTVDGAVNATGHGDHGKGWVEGNLSIGDGMAAINGSGTIYLKSKGRLLNIGSNKALRQLTLDGVTLVGLSDNDSSLVRINEGGKFVMKSGKITGNTFISEEYPSGGGVRVMDKGTFTMEGGEISGNTAKGGKGANGGGVFIGGGAVFTMKGGKISGNSSNSNGGGVRISSGAVLIMEGGEISGNTVQGGQSSRGGGVDMWEGTFTMSDGAITGNSAGWGGGIYIGSSTFTMEGGEISGNTAQDERAAGGGGVVVNNDGAFTLKGGTITGNSATRNSALVVNVGAAKWGTGGAYTKGGVPQTGGSNISSTDDMLIAVPGQ